MTVLKAAVQVPQTGHSWIAHHSNALNGLLLYMFPPKTYKVVLHDTSVVIEAPGDWSGPGLARARDSAKLPPAG